MVRGLCRSCVKQLLVTTCLDVQCSKQIDIYQHGAMRKVG